MNAPGNILGSYLLWRPGFAACLGMNALTTAGNNAKLSALQLLLTGIPVQVRCEHPK